MEIRLACIMHSLSYWGVTFCREEEHHARQPCCCPVDPGTRSSRRLGRGRRPQVARQAGRKILEAARGSSEGVVQAPGKTPGARAQAVGALLEGSGEAPIPRLRLLSR